MGPLRPGQRLSGALLGLLGVFSRLAGAAGQFQTPLGKLIGTCPGQLGTVGGRSIDVHVGGRFAKSRAGSHRRLGGTARRTGRCA